MTPDAPMPWIKPRYLWEDVDRHGNIRRYVARPGTKKIRIYAEPGSKEFYEAYALALDGISLPKNKAPQPIELAVAGSLRWLVEMYQASAEFLQLDLATRAARRNVLASCCNEPIEPGSPHLLDKIPLSKLSSSHVRMLRDRKKDHPEAANQRIKAVRALFKWALANDDIVRRFPIATNPGRDVPSLKSLGGDGFHTWTLEEVECFERHHPPGSTARLALALLLYTGQRKSDVILFGRQHIRKEWDPDLNRNVSWLRFTQYKNRGRKPVTLDLPVLDALQEAIDESKTGDLTFLTTEYGRAFTLGGFGNRMRKWCDDAGLPHCSAHGLRKAGACIAAEKGATEAQLNAIFGWRDPKMASHYTRKARQKKLAGGAMHLIAPERKKREPPLPLLEWPAHAMVSGDP